MIESNQEYLFFILGSLEFSINEITGLLERLSKELKHYRKVYEAQSAQKNDEAQSARSGYFNTLPRRPNVDKFNNRFSSKVQKYR